MVYIALVRQVLDTLKKQMGQTNNLQYFECFITDGLNFGTKYLLEKSYII